MFVKRMIQIGVIFLTFVYGVFTVDVDKLDGTLLSLELKNITNGVGVGHMQEKYDSFPYETSTETGQELLKKIQDNLDSSLKDLNAVLENIKKKIVDTSDTTSPSLPNCCEITQDQPNYMYMPEFQTHVSFDSACYTVPPTSTSGLQYPNSQISDAMKTNYKNNKNVLWQHFSTTEGVSIMYPATKFDDCRNFDPRFTSSYAAAASPSDKDVVIVLDSSSSMKWPSGVESKNRMVIAREAANNVIRTLKPNDRVGIVSFDMNAATPSDNLFHSCYQRELAFGTKVNTDKLKQYVNYISASDSPHSNFEQALKAAFSYFNNSNDGNLESRDQVILFVTDGQSTVGADPVQIIADLNEKFHNRIMVFTYLIGQDQEAENQLKQMAQQKLSNESFGRIKIGVSKTFNVSSQKFLSTQMASYYRDIGEIKFESTFTVPVVDPFSGIGLTTSLCLPVPQIKGLRGVVCTDVKISKLLKDVEYFSEDEFSYAFIIDGTGRVLMHPLLPDAAFVRSNEDPVLVDISVLERSPETEFVISSMKRKGTGSRNFTTQFTRPRGRLVNDGSSNIFKAANFVWGPIPRSNFSVCVVLTEESYSAIKETGLQQEFSKADLQNVFMYHNRSLLSKKDQFKECKFYKRRVVSDRSCVKFAPSAFGNPFQYIDGLETAEDVDKYKNFLTGASSINPGFKSSLRPSVWATYRAEQYWKTNAAGYVSWRYIGTKAGHIRIFPGVTLEKTYDHQKRTWWRQTLANAGKMTITTPYVDAWGSGIVITIGHTIMKKGTSQVTAVVAADFPLEYFSWFISKVYPSCNADKCIILNDSGFVVMNPKINKTTTEEDFQAPKHITVEEPGIAAIMRREGFLNQIECQDFSKNTNLNSFRVTLPQTMKSGLDFQNTDDNFELRPIPNSNLFIIRVRTEPTGGCSCDGSKLPDALECSSDCYCLCHNNIDYDVCLNQYKSDSVYPCSSRLPDTSGQSKADIIESLTACTPLSCNEQISETECLSKAECRWCKYTDIGGLITKPCCRPNEECTFGKTSPSKRNTCDPPPTPSPPSDDSQDSENTNLGPIIGGSLASGIFLTLIVIAGIYCCRHNRDKSNPADLYIDPLPDRTEITEYSVNCSSSDGSAPPPYQSNPNYYTES